MIDSLAAVQRAVDQLGAVEVAPGKYAFGDSTERPTYSIVETATLERYGRLLLDGVDVSGVAIHEQPGGCQHPLCDTCEEKPGTPVAMPRWWSPERQFFWHKNGFHYYHAERAKAYDATDRITVDLDTGKEVPYFPQAPAPSVVMKSASLPCSGLGL